MLIIPVLFAQGSKSAGLQELDNPKISAEEKMVILDAMTDGANQALAEKEEELRGVRERYNLIMNFILQKKIQILQNKGVIRT
jgi:hypothetical protein